MTEKNDALILIEEQHEEIFLHMSRLVKARDMEAIVRIMEALKDLFVKHFHTEKKAQEESHYPETADHQYHNSEFLYSFTQVFHEFQKRGDEIGARKAGEVNRGFAKWLIDHVNTYDAAFKDFYLKYKQGAPLHAS